MPKHDSSSARSAAAPARITRRQLEALSEVLLQVLSFRYPADQVLSRFFRGNKQLGGGDRRFIAESVYTGLRHYYWVKAMLAGETSPRRFGLAVLIGPRGFSVNRLEQLLSPADLSWAREAKGRKAGDTLWERAELPPWIVQALAEQYDEATVLKLGRALQESAPLDLRVNTIKADSAEVLKQLQADDHSVSTGSYSPTAIRLRNKPALQRHPLLMDGAIEVQDEGSQLVGLLLDPQPGERVVDFCAGAGGKTLHLGALMNGKGRIDAYDVSERRLKRLGPRLARSGLSNVRSQVIAHERDSHLKNRLGKADRVLVDAPCTGLGTIRRNPDLKFRQSEKTLQELTQQQASILAAAARLVRPGGRLVYATCSLMQKENQAIVDGFLAEHQAFQRVPVTQLLEAKGIELNTGDDLVLLPHEHACDGFYAAVLERQSEA